MMSDSPEWTKTQTMFLEPHSRVNVCFLLITKNCTTLNITLQKHGKMISYFGTNAHRMLEDKHGRAGKRR